MIWHNNLGARPNRTAGFTLIELLVVIGVIALLMGILMPSRSRVRGLARLTVCKSNLKGIGTGFMIYQAQNNDLVVPSYNMTGTNPGMTCALDGWGPILDHENVIPGNRSNTGSMFTCPDLKNVEGMAGGQTGTDPDKPKGWMDWPNFRDTSGASNTPTTIPERGLNRIIRVAYWINSNNPIGNVSTVQNDIYYTASVGYGPDASGEYMKQTRGDKFKTPYRMVIVADGVYAGKQSQNRFGMKDSRIGYRHVGDAIATTNTVLADGHVENIPGDIFPRGKGGTNVAADVVNESKSGPYTVYADADRIP